MPEKTQKEDRRTRYTRQVIKEAFLKLLEEKEYPKITVTEICRLAEINRGTFYLHYYDTADVLDDLLSEPERNTSVIDMSSALQEPPGTAPILSVTGCTAATDIRRFFSTTPSPHKS